MVPTIRLHNDQYWPDWRVRRQGSEFGRQAGKSRWSETPRCCQHRVSLDEETILSAPLPLFIHRESHGRAHAWHGSCQDYLAWVGKQGGRVAASNASLCERRAGATSEPMCPGMHSFPFHHELWARRMPSDGHGDRRAAGPVTACAHHTDVRACACIAARVHIVVQVMMSHAGHGPQPRLRRKSVSFCRGVIRNPCTFSAWAETRRVTGWRTPLAWRVPTPCVGIDARAFFSQGLPCCMT